jgi:hypothetical protein
MEISLDAQFLYFYTSSENGRDLIQRNQYCPKIIHVIELLVLKKSIHR